MSKPTVIWIPGWGTPAASLEPLATAVGDVANHVFVDWSACLSDWGAGWETRESALADLPASLLLRIDADPQPIVLAGWSLGAMLALRGAAAQPGRVGGLIMIGGAARFVAGDELPGTPPRVLDAMRRKLAEPGKLGEVMDDFFKNAAAPAAYGALPKKLADQARIGFTQQDLARGLDYLAAEDLRHAWARVAHIPALVLHGAEDAIVPFLCAEWLAARHGECQLGRIEGAGHLLPLGQPESIARPIFTYLMELNDAGHRA